MVGFCAVGEGAPSRCVYFEAQSTGERWGFVLLVKATLSARQHSVRRRLCLTLVGIFVICFSRLPTSALRPPPIDEPFSVNGSTYVVFVACRALASA